MEWKRYVVEYCLKLDGVLKRKLILSHCTITEVANWYKYERQRSSKDTTQCRKAFKKAIDKAGSLSEVQMGTRRKPSREIILGLMTFQCPLAPMFTKTRR